MGGSSIHPAAPPPLAEGARVAPAGFPDAILNCALKSLPSVALGDPDSTFQSLGLPSTALFPYKVLAVEEGRDLPRPWWAWWPSTGPGRPSLGRQVSAGLCTAAGRVHFRAGGVLSSSSDAKQPSGKMNTCPRHTV